MTRPDDASLTHEQLLTVRRQADILLREAAAYGRFPTPVDDLMAAAKLTVVDDQLIDSRLLRRFLRTTKASVSTLKSAFSKVLGLFDPHDRLVVIDKDVPVPRIPFVKLHEAGHGSLPHQSGLYRLIHDCRRTLDPDIADLFEREANVFASETLFQGDAFAAEAHSSDFSLKVPMQLARKYGASNYATFRRYVHSSPRTCCLIALEPVVHDAEGGFQAEVRRVVASSSFEAMFDPVFLTVAVTDKHWLADVVPLAPRRMIYPHEVVLTDRNGGMHRCSAEAFDTTHQILILICRVSESHANTIAHA